MGQFLTGDPGQFYIGANTDVASRSIWRNVRCADEPFRGEITSPPLTSDLAAASQRSLPRRAYITQHISVGIDQVANEAAIQFDAKTVGCVFPEFLHFVSWGAARASGAVSKGWGQRCEGVHCRQTRPPFNRFTSRASSAIDGIFPLLDSAENSARRPRTFTGNGCSSWSNSAFVRLNMQSTELTDLHH